MTSSRPDKTMDFLVTDQTGVRHACAAETGSTVMQAIRDSGLEIAALCGGCCSCATCHVYVDGATGVELEPAGADEIAMLELAIDVKPISRLSCQIVASEALSGLSVTLAPGTTL